MMRRVLVILLAALVFAPEALAQRQTPSGSQGRPPSQKQLQQQKQQPLQQQEKQQQQQQQAKPQGSPAEQLQACRQHVVQLDEQLRTNQKRLTTLRTERKTIGVSGGEVAQFKLSTIDQEIRDLSRQSQSLLAQIETEGNRCQAIEARISGGDRGTQSQPPARQPAGTRKQ